MRDRRQHLRYQLLPPLKGRAFADGVGQFDARLLDVSVEGARMALALDGHDNWTPFLSGEEKTITGVFARPEGAPWKFVLLHTRLTELVLDSGEAGCVVAGRFVAVPSFTAADLEALVAESGAACFSIHESALVARGVVDLAMLREQAERAVALAVTQVDLSGASLAEPAAIREWVAGLSLLHPTLTVSIGEESR